MNVAVIDYGMGNLRSVAKAVERVGGKSFITSNFREIRSADRLILPGVGHFARGMQLLDERGVIDLLHELVIQRRVPLLGICLGMQLLAKYSEEGSCDGLGWIDSSVVRFEEKRIKPFKIPHIGWNTIEIHNDNILTFNLDRDESYYFVHSYYMRCGNEENIVATTKYGVDFVSIVAKDNIFGTQFHPEKSHGIGLELLKNFINLG